MRLRRAAGCSVVQFFVLALLVEGSNTARKKSDSRAKNYEVNRYPSRSVTTTVDYAKYLDEKYTAPPLLTVERLAKRGLLDAYNDPDLKALEKRTEESYRQKNNLNADEEIDVYDAEFLETLQKQVKLSKGESKTTSDESENRLATRGLLLRIVFGGSPWGTNSASKNEPKGVDASQGQADPSSKNEPGKTQSPWSCRSLFSKIWSFYSRPKPAETTKPPEITKRDLDGSRWFSDKFSGRQTEATSNQQEQKLTTRGLLGGIWGSPAPKAKPAEDDGQAQGQAEDTSKNEPEKTQSSRGCRSWFSKLWPFHSRPKPAEITEPAEITIPAEITKPEATKRDNEGSRWFSKKFSGRETDATSNQQEQKLATRGILDGLWGSPAPKAAEKPAATPAADDGHGQDPPADGDVDPGQGDYYYDDPTADQTGLPAFQEPEQTGKPEQKPEQTGKPEQKPEQTVAQDTTPPASQNWWQRASRWALPSPQSEKPQEKAPEQQQGKPPAPDKATKPEDNTGGGWLNWGAPKPKAPEQKAEPKDYAAGAGQSGWLWGSPASPETSSRAPPVPASKSGSSGGLLSWLNGGEDEKPKNSPPKQHGPLRSLVKTVEHTIMPFKGVRRALKSIPGVRPTRKTMKSTLDAVDSVVDTEYVRHIRTAAAESRKRVGAKAVGLADAVWELGTGTTDTTLNMVDTLRKESARTLDSVTVAFPPTRSAVDYVKTKMADGVGFLQEENDRIRKQGKGVLSRISGGAVGTAQTEAPTPAAGGAGGIGERDVEIHRMEC
ncbi:unnamed protein product [Bemisia tabaci]|uniref:Uncharacterized protein n=1 Tax=Bemisia tabaci TaxID=7038 RepID=A0A9P0G2S0_BEMTA|nr:unnamed protein product [Bemisia tabaci]